MLEWCFKITLLYWSDRFVLKWHIEVTDFGAEKKWRLCRSDVLNYCFELTSVLKWGDSKNNLKRCWDRTACSPIFFLYRTRLDQGKWYYLTSFKLICFKNLLKMKFKENGKFLEQRFCHRLKKWSTQFRANRLDFFNDFFLIFLRIIHHLTLRFWRKLNLSIPHCKLHMSF